ncbi:DUF4148 domain-containing protein [Paraburkholderia tropica]|uniref:Uncharacterized protein DUF4148 n=1 Tax=Paraburkholderia tropica TaxID=92647 RepID=A0ABX5MEC9_9BURK|nr:DUF4148 domain-containing protein [Paraburkholderia tropica]PXX02558.1 uncharacterized protein DUF4148 [Paraburkholderia tropica]PZW69166.1 uncharacterized protein DUF4148 [Paraburkholderia tropica]
MKIRLFAALIVASAIAAPAFAGADAPALTRAQVRAELVQLQAAGYGHSRGEDANYPVEIQAAEARVAVQNSGASSYGGVVADGSSAAGVRKSVRHLDNDGMQSVYFGQ